MHYLQRGEFVFNRDFNADFFQVRKQLFPARVAPKVDLFGSAG